jgi:hypothetical protein
MFADAVPRIVEADAVALFTLTASVLPPLSPLMDFQRLKYVNAESLETVTYW